MTSVKLYRLLQLYVGTINSFAVKLREDEMDKVEVRKLVIENTKTLLKELK